MLKEISLLTKNWYDWCNYSVTNVPTVSEHCQWSFTYECVRSCNVRKFWNFRQRFYTSGQIFTYKVNVRISHSQKSALYLNTKTHRFFFLLTTAINETFNIPQSIANTMCLNQRVISDNEKCKNQKNNNPGVTMREYGQRITVIQSWIWINSISQ